MIPPVLQEVDQRNWNLAMLISKKCPRHCNESVCMTHTLIAFMFIMSVMNNRAIDTKTLSLQGLDTSISFHDESFNFMCWQERVKWRVHKLKVSVDSCYTVMRWVGEVRKSNPSFDDPNPHQLRPNLTKEYAKERKTRYEWPLDQSFWSRWQP